MHSQFIKKILAVTEIAVIMAGIFMPLTLDWPERGGEINLAQWLQNLSKIQLEKQEAEAAAGAWYSSSWPYRKKIVVDRKKVAGDSNLNNFPILVSRTDTDLKGSASGGFVQRVTGEDIFFTTLAGTKLNHEIESYTPTTGNFIGWVQATISIGFDNVMYMYYGATGQSSQSNATGVWNSNGYKGVWHLKEDPTVACAGANEVCDSSANDSDGNNENMDSGDQKAAKINGGLDFDGVNEDIDMGNPTALDITGTALTVSAWFKVNAGADGGQMVVKADTNSAVYCYAIYLNSTPGFGGYIGGTSCSGLDDTGVGSTLIKGQWYYGVLVKNGTGAGALKTYINGQEHKSITSNKTIGSNTVAFQIGDFTGATRDAFDGLIDEARVANVSRDPAWILTEYRNQNSPSTFMAIGKQEAYKRTTAGSKVGKTSVLTGNTWYSSSWPYRKKIVVDRKKVAGDSNLNNFPILVSRTDTDLKGSASGGFVQRVTGEDIFFTTLAGTKLNHEIESYTPTTGNYVGWIQATISPSFDTVMYMYYGASGQSNQSNATGVWNSNGYKGVYHVPDGTTLSANDSTSNNNDGTVNGSAAATAGKIDGAMNRDSGSTTQEIDTVDAGLDLGTSSRTISTWLRCTAAQANTWVFMINKSPGGKTETAANTGYEIAWDARQLRFGMADGTNSLGAREPGSTSCGGQWHYVVGVYDTSLSTKGYLYINGALSATNGTTNLSTTDNAGSLSIGCSADGCNSTDFAGQLDEVRISNTARSPAWITTEYRNQNSPSSFAAFGKQEAYKRTASGAKVGKTSSLTGNTWYSSSWPYRKKIVVDRKKVAGDSNLNNFPILVSRTDTDLKGSASGGFVQRVTGEDIFFTTLAGTKLNHEIESYTPTTGNYVGWIQATISSSFDTVMYMYYGASGQSSQSNAVATWDGNYRAVYHLNETVTDEGTSGTHTDSTGRHNGTQSGNDDVAAKILNGQNFDGNDRITAAGKTSSSGYTVETWARPTAVAGNNCPCTIYSIHFQGTQGFHWLVFLSGGLRWQFSDGVAAQNADANYPVNFRVGQWAHFAITHNYSAKEVKFYHNGVLFTVVTHSVVPLVVNDPPDSVALGSYIAGSGSSFLIGDLDELRTSTGGIRSSDWIKTGYRNQNSPSTFMAIGRQEVRVKTAPPSKSR